MRLLACLLGVVLGVLRWGGRGKAEPYTPVSKSEPYSTCLTPNMVIDASDKDPAMLHVVGLSLYYKWHGY